MYGSTGGSRVADDGKGRFDPPQEPANPVDLDTLPSVQLEQSTF
jgi:hypothetical protein